LVLQLIMSTATRIIPGSAPGANPSNIGSLTGIFNPNSIAVILADDRPKAIGEKMLETVLSSAFRGPKFVIRGDNSSTSEQPSYATLSEAPGQVDLAVLIASPHAAPALVEECVARRVKGVLLLSSGFGDFGSDCARASLRMQAVLKGSATRMVGPNSLGVMVPPLRLNATSGLPMPLSGTVAVLSESATLGKFLLDWSYKNIVGFSAFACLGSMLDVSWGNLIDYFGSDPNTKTIIIQMSCVGDARSLISAAREVALAKPVIVMKTGRGEAAIRAVAWNSRCMLSDDSVLAAAFRRVGVLHVDSLEDLFYAADALSKQPRPRGPRLMVVGNADGAAVLAGDMVVRSGVQLVSPTPESRARMAALLSLENHVDDAIGDGSCETYLRAVQIAAGDPNCDGLLVLMTPSAMTHPEQAAELLVELGGSSLKPILLSYMSTVDTAAAQATAARACIPTFSSPAIAARIFQYMWRYSYDLQALYQTPITHHGAEEFASRKLSRELLENARREGRNSLSHEESRQVLQAYGIETRETATGEARIYAAKLGSRIDPQFGPILIFGSADRGEHAYGDAVVGLPPLNATLARLMLEQSNFYRAIGELDSTLLDKLQTLVVRFSELIVEQRWIKELEINPLIIHRGQVIAAASHCELHGTQVADNELPRPAIRPYPVQYVSSWIMKNGEQVNIRPIRAEDEPLMVKFHEGLSDESVYLRYFQHVKLSVRTAHERLARVCFLDYDREIGLLAEYLDPSTNDTRAVAIGTLQKMFPKSEGEVAVLVSDNYHGQGLGKELIARLVSFARDEQLQVVSATTMVENYGMTAIFKRLGFKLSTDEDQLVTAKLFLTLAS
jgi:acetyltransferase